jgi:hypothetical protein
MVDEENIFCKRTPNIKMQKAGEGFVSKSKGMFPLLILSVLHGRIRLFFSECLAQKITIPMRLNLISYLQVYQWKPS